jgi:Bacterial regulatory proteins, luxR family
MIEEMPEEPSPPGPDGGTTSVRDLRLTDTQRRILLALCRPCMGDSRYATPATNQEIASELFLSVDAIKAHLRALYRKFGVEPLPHNQKRARLVELVLEGGIVPTDEPPDVVTPAPADSRRPGRRRALVGSAIALGLIGLALAAILSGGSDESAEEAPSKVEYVAAVNGYCRLALGRLEPVGGQRRSDAATADRAGNYLAVLETMRGRLESLTPPAEGDRALERFRAGLRRAADFTDVVARRPPPPGSRQGANVVAELTLAAGQVQAGALGYHLGRDCTGIGEVVARSARNAARAP